MAAQGTTDALVPYSPPAVGPYPVYSASYQTTLYRQRMSPGAKVAWISAAVVGGAAGGLLLWYELSPATYPLPWPPPKQQQITPPPTTPTTGGAPTSTTLFTAKRLGFALGTNPSAKLTAAVQVITGSMVTGVVQVANATKASQDYALRGWILLLGVITDPSKELALSNTNIFGTVEGHFLNQAAVGASETAVGTLSAGESSAVAMFAGPMAPKDINRGGSAGRLSVLWAVGPPTTIQAMPADGGVLTREPGVTWSVAYNAILPVY